MPALPRDGRRPPQGRAHPRRVRSRIQRRGHGGERHEPGLAAHELRLLLGDATAGAVSTMNRLHNCKNPYQGAFKKVVCVCSAGLLRSPTAAVVLSQPPFNFNTRAVGLVSDYALIPLDECLLGWADEIVCMSEKQAEVIRSITDKPVINLDIDDCYAYRDPKLVELIYCGYLKATAHSAPQPRAAEHYAHVIEGQDGDAT